MLVTVAEFNQYTEDMSAETADVTQKEMILKSAQKVATDYLRYDPDVTGYEWPDVYSKDLVKLTILRIATLMLMETGENIGVTGKSFTDNSKSFINYANYTKYLRPLDGLRKPEF